ncbi:hypothetical protein HDA32_004431 [Spinactinospora alkalitolerans]|uniref:Uncharacterized protein n=1 Tax=Spinactinospora alkalitolerans TaxID=687207 RepID=A0A852TZR0_9ACTN|nr:hypothetical protein [Spinactinospora alkalitolerans]NYE49311.1 hypothetical protein [Spinactinospora alkalitolerans]
MSQRWSGRSTGCPEGPPGSLPPFSPPDRDELVAAADAAPLVDRLWRFLEWIGAGRPVSRDAHRGPHGREDLVLLGIGRWVGDDEVPDGPADTDFEDAAELLAILLEGGVVRVEAETRRRRSAEVQRRHGRVVPASEERLRRPHASLVLWRTVFGQVPLLWRRRDPHAFGALTERLLPRLLLGLCRAEGRPVPAEELVEAANPEGLGRSGFEIAFTLLEALGVLRRDGDPDIGDALALTPLGHYAAASVLAAGGHRLRAAGGPAGGEAAQRASGPAAET